MIDCTRRRGLLGLGAALAFYRPGLAAAGEALSAPVDVALDEAQSRFFLDVAINGEAGLRFVLDTGLTTHIVSQSVAKRLRLQQVDRRMVQAFDGRKSEPVVAMAALRVGGVDMGPTRAIAWADDRLDGHDGLIGYPYLAPRAVIALGSRKLSLGGPGDGGGVSVDAEVDQRGAVLVGGLPEALGRFSFDTGAKNFVISRDYHQRLLKTEAYRLADKLTFSGGDISERVLGFRPAALRFGDLTIIKPFINISPDDDRQGVFSRVDGLVGVSLLRRYVWSIDTAAGRLRAFDASLLPPT